MEVPAAAVVVPMVGAATAAVTVIARERGAEERETAALRLSASHGRADTRDEEEEARGVVAERQDAEEEREGAAA